MAEWSKALDLSSSIRKNAQVRTLQKALWGISSIGRVRRLQRRGTGIETRILHLFFRTGHRGRVVKAVDSKSTGLRPRRFESYRCRFLCRLSIVVIAPAL